uniref:RNA-directed DNA polymerase n=1 Tax=Anopheles minimus TaxID=112268 RepID=A0A182W922_9DIPT
MQHVDALSRAGVMLVSAGICERVRKEQQCDPKLAEILQKLYNGEQVDDYFAKDGVLYKGDAISSNLCVPITMEVEIIKNAHDQGHFGIKKTKERLASDYYISGVEAKIERCIAACVKCILGEKKRGKAEGFLNPIPKGEVPFDTFHIDHLGPIPSTKKSYNYVFTATNRYAARYHSILNPENSKLDTKFKL